MKLGVLFSGGKDSVYATWIAQKQGYEISCLITIEAENKESFMYHTPSIRLTKLQAEQMNLPLIIKNTKGEKETELNDLRDAIIEAIENYEIDGVVTGALQSIYQTSRIQKICNDLNIECFNPLWQKDELEHLNDLIKNGFDIILTGIFAYPLDKSWLGRKIEFELINDLKKLNEKYKIHVAGEGGEFETFVLNCPLFNKKLEVKSFKDFSTGENSWRRELELR